MVDAVFGLMTLNAAIEGMNGQIGFTVATEPIAASLLAALVARRHLAQAQNLYIKKQHHFRVEGVVGDMTHSWKTFFLRYRDAEASGRQTHWAAFRVVNADLA